MKRVAWVHWISARWANTVEFLSEARRQGIRLGVSLECLERMSWKDDIYCIRRVHESKAPSVFCRFPVDLVSGLSRDASALVKERLDCKEVEPGGDFVDRGGKSYMEGATGRVNANMQDLCAVLKIAQAGGVDIGKLVIGCSETAYTVLAVPWPMLSRVRFSKGFRQFDARAYLLDVHEEWMSILVDVHEDRYEEKIVGQRFISLPSEYHAAEAPTGELPGLFQWVEDYASLPKTAKRKRNHGGQLTFLSMMGG